jgi:phage shock protein C
MPVPKKYFRSRTDKQLAGVIGGLAEYFGLDSSLLRLLWVLITVFTGFVPGLFVYFVAILIVPLGPSGPGRGR